MAIQEYDDLNLNERWPPSKRDDASGQRNDSDRLLCSRTEQAGGRWIAATLVQNCCKVASAPAFSAHIAKTRTTSAP